VIIELFSLDVTAKALLANINWKSPFFDGWVDLAGAKFQIEGTSPPTILRVAKLDASVSHMV